ncbi:aminodeoxychorismate lyase [Heyndrickxia sp. MSNUG]|uniref:aminodeoxychorismate lyase n=1 Tax=Heyndrickxia sp. MSNUG TaxID=3136677 RepID=UPI003C2AAFBA
MYVYINGQYAKKEEVVISPFDHGFLYGLGVFETFRIYNGHPFLLDDHLKRLNAGMKMLNIDAAFNRKEVIKIINELLAKNGYTHAYIRFNVSAGNGEIGLQTESYSEPNILMFSKPLPPLNGMTEKKAVILEIKRNTPEGGERLKSHHYLNNVLAKREIGSAPDMEGIFLTQDGFLSEGIVSNVFWYNDGILFTPAIETGILNGITRRFVIALAREAGLTVREGFYKQEEAENAEEMFLTNSIQEIVPVTRFFGTDYPGREGNIVKILYKYYEAHRETLWSRTQLGGPAND